MNEDWMEEKTEEKQMKEIQTEEPEITEESGGMGAFAKHQVRVGQQLEAVKWNKKAGWLSLAGVFLYLALSFLPKSVSAYLNDHLVASVLTAQAVVLVLPLVFLFWFKRNHDHGLLQFKRMGFVNLLLLGLLTITIYPVLTGVNLISQLFVENKISADITAASETIPFWAMFLVVAIIPAIVEELVYRGVYFGTFRRESIFKGALISGVLFGMMHMNFNQFAYATVLGFVFALIDAALETLHASMIMHCLYNGFSVCMVYALPYVEKMLGDSEESSSLTDMVSDTVMSREQLMAMVKSYLPTMVIGAVLSFFLFRTLALRCNTWEKIKKSVCGKESGSYFEILSIPLLLTFLVLIGVMFLMEKLA